MAGRILKSDIDEVRARVNLADVVGEYVPLKSAGVGSLKGLCPFHDERSPSFHVRPQVGLFHCFGCGEGGDVYTFLQKIDHVTFAEAVERMAARVGLTLRYEDGSAPAQEAGNRARLLAANRAAAEFFVERLATPPADVGRRFLGERGFDRAAAAHFGVGFAPKSWDELTKHLRGKGFSDQELLAAGLVSSGDRGVYDRFRGRVVWPIRDTSGETVGFGARRLFDDDKGPKYLNTPETAIYHKAQVLYGLDLAKRDISRNRQVVLVEGYTDVMACHLAGITTAVATSGTSFGVDHIKVLRRVLGDDSVSGEVIFTFDPDAAGQKAAVRAFAEEQRFAAQTYVATGPEGLDPCDLRLAQGDEAVRAMIDAKKPMYEFIIRNQLRAHDLDTVEGRVAALRAAAPVVAEIRDPSLRPGYARELARWLGLDLQEVSAAVAAAGTRSAADRSARQRGEDPIAGGQRTGDARFGGRRGGEPPTGERPDRRMPPAASPRGEQQRGPAAVPHRGSPQRVAGSAPERGAAPAGARGTPGLGSVAAGPRRGIADVRPEDFGPPPPEDHEAPPDEREAPPEYDERDPYVGAAAPEPAPVRGPTLGELPSDPATRLERDALMAVLQHPQLVGRPLFERSMRAGFVNRALAAVRDAVAASVDAVDSAAWLEQVTAAAPAALAPLVQQLAIAPLPQQRGEEALTFYVQDVASRLVDRDLLRRKSDLLRQLQRTPAAEDPDRYRGLQRELVTLETERRSLREG